MKLIDLLEDANENKNFIVKSQSGDIIALYDGKNSIPEKINNCYVIKHDILNSGDTIAYIMPCKLSEKLTEKESEKLFVFLNSFEKAYAYYEKGVYSFGCAFWGLTTTSKKQMLEDIKI